MEFCDGTSPLLLPQHHQKIFTTSLTNARSLIQGKEVGIINTPNNSTVVVPTNTVKIVVSGKEKAQS